MTTCRICGGAGGQPGDGPRPPCQACIDRVMRYVFGPDFSPRTAVSSPLLSVPETHVQSGSSVLAAPRVQVARRAVRGPQPTATTAPGPDPVSGDQLIVERVLLRRAFADTHAVPTDVLVALSVPFLAVELAARAIARRARVTFGRHDEGAPPSIPGTR